MKDVSVIIILYKCEIDFFSRLVEPLFDSVREIIIVSNSELDDTRWVERANDAKFILIQNKENLGIAEAQNLGVTNAKGKYILFFDQDSKVDRNFACAIVSAFEMAPIINGRNLGVLSALDHDETTGSPNKKRLDASTSLPGSNLRLVSNTLSSGSLMPASLFRELGGNDKWMFIDQVDNDLCYRVAAAEYYVGIDSSIVLAHNLGEGKGSFFGLEYGISSPFRNYYQVRNMIYLLSKDYVRPRNKLKLLKGVLFKVFLACFVLDKKMERMSFVVRGLRDGVRYVFLRK